jgi:hypothetical protein
MNDLYVAFLARTVRPRPQFPLLSTKDAPQAIAMTDREVFIASRRKPNGFGGLPNDFIEAQLGVEATTVGRSSLRPVGHVLYNGAASGLSSPG